MDKANFYCYVAGKESESICRDITGEICGVDWQLGDIDHKEFSQKICNADLVIIVTNLNNYSEMKSVDFMVKIAGKLKVPTLVYALFPIRFDPQVGDKGTWLAQLDNIRKATVLIVLDDDLPASNINEPTTLTQHYISEGFDHLSTKLIVAIRAVTDPVIRQELIGVDFANYRLAFANQGFYQTKEYSYEALNQAEVNNDNWLQAKVIFATIYLKNKDALDVYSSTSGAICNMLKGSDALLLICPIIEEYVHSAPVTVIFFK
jgi:cell division GTPase FtsZ